MNKLFLIAFSNIRKKKGENFTIGILITFASLLLFVSLHTLLNLERVSEASYNNSNLADYELIAMEEFKDVALETVKGKAETKDYESESGLRAQSVKMYHEAKETDPTEVYCAFFPVDRERNLSRLTEDIDLDQFPENGIILTKYMEKAEGYKKGEVISLSFAGNTYKFEVAGFSEDALFATPLNISTSKIFISEKMYEKIGSENSEVDNIFDLKVKINNKSESRAYERSVLDTLYVDAPLIANTDFVSVNWSDMKHGIAMMPQISMVVILGFAIVIMFIILAVLYYNIKNFMDVNMTNIGILKAAGYTSYELRLSLMLQFLMISLIASLLGTGIGLACGKILGSVVATLMGIEWRMGIDFLYSLVTILVVTGFVVLIVLLLGRKYRSIFVLDALRGGISNHNFKKDAVSLSKSPLPLPVSLGFKSILHEKKKNIVISIIISFLAFASCASLFIYNNFGSNTDTILNMTGVEVTPVFVMGDTRYEELDPTTIPGIKDALFGNNADLTLRANGHETTANIDCWSDPSKLKYEKVVDGRLPENDNEIILTGCIRDELDAEIGDIIYLVNGDETKEFMLVGVDQKINHFGRKGIITIEGMRRLAPTVKPAAVYFDLEEGETYESIKDRVIEAYPNASVNDGNNTIASTLGGVTKVFYYICLFFLIATYSVVFFILYMISKSRIIEQKKQLGISKAIGFTTRQLVVENMVTITPVVLTGGLLGLVLTCLFANPFISLILSAIGFGRSDYPHNVLSYLLAVAFLAVDAIAVTLILSSKVRGIEPVKMIRE